MERTVTGYFDYIEDLIERENVFTMEEFEKSVNAFLEFRQYKILKDNGDISHRQAVEKAYGEYEIYNKNQPIESDFDKVIKEMIEKNGECEQYQSDAPALGIAVNRSCKTKKLIMKRECSLLQHSLFGVVNC